MKYRKTILTVCCIIMFMISCTESEKPITDSLESDSSTTNIKPDLSETLAGTWEGTLSAGGQDLLIKFMISSADSGFSAMISVPQQNLYNHPADTISITGNQEIAIELTSLKAGYQGTIKENLIQGTWKQSGMSIVLNLEKISETVSEMVKREQDPTPPYPYTAQDIYFTDNETGITFGGTVTVPNGEGPFPACILVSGSGQQNRDEEIFNHRPFLVLADALSRAGIAVLRYDDRGVGESGGDPMQATTLDFSHDAAAALNWLSDQLYVNQDAVGVIGHSEGGAIAVMLGSERSDIDWLVLLAAPGVPGNELLLAQSEAIMRASHMSEQQIKTTAGTNAKVYELAVSSIPEADKIAAIRRELIKIGMPPDQADVQTQTLLIPWMKYFLALDPAHYLSQIRVPVLALNGTKDLQVIYTQNLPAIEESLKAAENTRVITKALPNLNHLFQPADTGLVQEYGLIETTFDLSAITEITTWIMEIVK
ncbi:MAG: alpha/beta hydrolase [Bacteroidetes bacterium]|nr:alpha/beta hydrolase [Bacteroidota bacterium]